MKTSTFIDDEEPRLVPCEDGLVDPAEVIISRVETGLAETWVDAETYPTEVDKPVEKGSRNKDEETSPPVSCEDVTVSKPESPERWMDSQVSLAEAWAAKEERWSDPLTSPRGFEEAPASDTEPALPPFEQMSDMYYTASSEVSLLSDTEVPERVADEEEKGDRKEGVIAGHVAAMRERFESMTRANTPCPDLLRSSSPSLDVFRNVTPSPDRLG